MAEKHRLIPKTFAGEDLQTVEFRTDIGEESTPLARTERTVEVERLGNWPKNVRSQPEGAQVVLTATVEEGNNPYVVQERLTEIFRPGRRGFLIVNVEEPGEAEETRAVDAHVVSTIPLVGNGVIFQVVLRTPDPRMFGATKVINGAEAITSALPIVTDVVRDAGVEGDGLPFPQGYAGLFRGSENLLTNGGLETNTTGWDTSGTNVLTRVSDDEKVKFGDYSAQVTVNDSLFIFHTPFASPFTFASAGDYVISCEVRARDWDGGDLSIKLTGFAGSTEHVRLTADLSNSTREYVKLYASYTIDAAGLSGYVLVSTDSLPTAGTLVQVDGLQLETGDHPTPYIETDGATDTRAAAYVEVDAGSMDETRGWFAFKVWPGWTNDATTTDRSVFFWGNATDHLRLYYDATANQIKFSRMASSTATTVGLASSTTWRDQDGYVTYIVEWNATTIGISQAGGALTTTANAHIPDLSAVANYTIGYDSVNTEYLDGWLVRAETGTGATTASLRSEFAASPDIDNLLVMTTDLTKSNVWKARGLTVAASTEKSALTGRALFKLTMGGSSTDRLLQVIRNPDKPFTFYEVPSGTKIRASLEARSLSAGQQLKIRVSDDNGDGTDDTEQIFAVSQEEQTFEVTHTVTASRDGYLAFSIEAVGATSDVFYVGSPGVQVVTTASASDGSVVPASSVKLPGPKIAPGATNPGIGPNFGNLGVGSRSKIDPNLVPGGGGGGPSGSSFVVQVPQLGTTPTRNAIFLFRPDAAKSSANFYNVVQDIIVANRSPEPLTDYPIQLVSAFNHAGRVAGGQSTASGDDLLILVDGVPVNRFPSSASDFNTSSLDLWANMSLQGGRFATLLNDITASAPSVGEKLIVSRGETAGFPEKGVLLVGSEVIFYSEKGSDYFLVSARGGRDTTAAVHSSGDRVTWVEKRVEFLYSASSEATEFLKYDARREPMIDLEQSTNTKHVWTTARGFYTTNGDPRSAQWARSSDFDADSQAFRITVPNGEPADSLKFVYKREGAEPGFPAFNRLSRACPVGTVKTANDTAAATMTVTGNGEVGAVVQGVSEDGQRATLGLLHNRKAFAEDASNILTAESFEGDLGGYVTNGNNTAVSSREAYVDGNMSLKLLYAGSDTTLGGWAVTLGNTNPHTISMWVYAPGGTNITATGAWTGATITTSVPGDSVVHQGGGESFFERIAVYVTPTSGNLTGTITLTCTGAASGDVFYVDAFLVEEQQRQRPFYSTDRAVPSRDVSFRSIDLYGRSMVIAAPPRASTIYIETDLQANVVEYNFTSPGTNGTIFGSLLYHEVPVLGSASFFEKERMTLGYYDGGSPAQFVELNRKDSLVDRVIPPQNEAGYVFFRGLGPTREDQQELVPGFNYTVRWTGGENTENSGSFPNQNVRTFASPPLDEDIEYPDCRILSFDIDPLEEARATEDSDVTITDVTINFDADEAPYVDRVTTNSSKYVADVAITNMSTGQTMTFFATMPSASGSSIVIDMGGKQIFNLESDEPNPAVYSGATFSDPARWIELIPGDNDILVSDQGATDFLLRIQFADFFA